VSALLVLVKTGMVFGLLAAVLFVLKKTDGLGGRARGGLLEVRGSTRLGKGAALTVVRVDGKDLLLGVTDHTVTLLTSEAAPVETAEPVRRTGLLDSLKSGFSKNGSTQLAPEAVAAALAALRGETPPRATDGTVATTRTDARPAEEQPCADPAVA
jgi:flagellar biogenesis protein FliO